MPFFRFYDLLKSEDQLGVTLPVTGFGKNVTLWGRKTTGFVLVIDWNIRAVTEKCRERILFLNARRATMLNGNWVNGIDTLQRVLFANNAFCAWEVNVVLNHIVCTPPLCSTFICSALNLFIGGLFIIIYSYLLTNSVWPLVVHRRGIVQIVRVVKLLTMTKWK